MAVDDLPIELTSEVPAIVWTASFATANESSEAPRRRATHRLCRELRCGELSGETPANFPSSESATSYPATSSAVASRHPFPGETLSEAP